MLDASIAMTVGALEVDVHLHAAAGEVLAVLGPNGAGKTSLLRALSGLRAIDRGRIAIDGRVVDEPAADVFVPPNERPIGVVFQDYLLFAHLNALDNVAFGLRARGTGRDAARRSAYAWLDRLGLTERATAKPVTLSGGEQQRVALARALITDPKLLLLDEPLTALDATTRTTVRRDLRTHLAGFEGVRVLVTHDPLDAYALADRVAILENGRIVQSGTLADVAARPRSRYVAQLVGTNLLTGTVTADGHFAQTSTGFTLTVDADFTGDAYAAIAPQAVALYRQRPEGSPRNVWSAHVESIDPALDRVRVTLASPLHLTAELTTAGLAALGVHPGDDIWASVKATEIAVYSA
ncbi:MAG: ABC transporter ATP-binding protein [Acidimicrobiia bacterium]